MCVGQRVYYVTLKEDIIWFLSVHVERMQWGVVWTERTFYSFPHSLLLLLFLWSSEEQLFVYYSQVRLETGRTHIRRTVIVCQGKIILSQKEEDICLQDLEPECLTNKVPPIVKSEWGERSLFHRRRLLCRKPFCTEILCHLLSKTSIVSFNSPSYIIFCYVDL